MSALTPVDEVLDRILSAAQIVTESEVIPLDQSLGRISAEEIKSSINVPPADNSAMDGYALNASDADIQLNTAYSVSDRIAAGSQGKKLEAGTLARIFTGAEIPPGANAVIMQEKTESKGDKIILHQLPKVGQNVRTRGQDIHEGSKVLETGKRLGPEELGLLASVGYSKIKVYQPLKVGILTTGDELVEPPTPLKPGQIYNSNRYTLRALVRGLGMEVVDFGVVEDTVEATRLALTKGAQSSDCVVSSGGVSVGEEDYVKQVVEELGELNIWRIAIKPGKPLAYGSVDGTPFFGLPGNPVSSFITFCLIARPFLLKMQGCSSWLPDSYHAAVNFDYAGGTRREYLRVRAEETASGTEINLFPNQGSGIMSSVSWANALAQVEIGQQVKSGDLLKIYPLKNMYS